MEKLVIIDLRKNHLTILKKNCKYINIGRGTVSFDNSFEINIKKIFEKNKFFFLNQYFANLKKNQKKWDDLFNEEKFEELEFLNSRNDKYNFFNKFIYIFCLNNFIKKKNFKYVEVISDQELYIDLYRSLFAKIKICIINQNKLKIGLKIFFLRIFFQFLKNIFLIYIIKILFINKNISSSHLFLSIYPRFFYKKKDNFYKKKKSCFLNLTLSDGIFIHNNLFQSIKNIFEIKLTKDVIPLEKYITFGDICTTYIKLIFNFYKAKYNFLNSMKIGNLVYTKIINQYLLESFAQRLFLNIYSEALKKVLKPDIKVFNLYCFEYSIGFYFIKKIRTINPFIKIFGHQHGIFTNKLHWFTFLNQSKNKFLYIVDKIYSQNLLSLKSYNRLNISKDIYLIKRNKYKFNFRINKKINIKNISKVLVILGTHDAYDILYSIASLLKDNPEKKIIFFAKCHPRMKLIINNDLTDNRLRFVNSFKGYYDLVLCSDTTTVAYDLINSKVKFKIIELNNKTNLFFSNFKNKLSINELINKI